MTYRNIIRVWKGKEDRRRLSKEQHAMLPEHPAGLMELADVELDAVPGAGADSLGWGPLRLGKETSTGVG